jgi:hypothetical protein
LQKFALGLVAALALTLIVITSALAGSSPPQLAAGEPHGLIQPRGAGEAGTGGDLLYHGGPILPASTVVAIFFGKSWPAYSGDEMTGLDSLYRGLGGSHYANTNTEYTGAGGQVGTGVTYNGHLVDGSGSFTRAPRTTAVLKEVQSALAANGVAPVTNGYYPVYSDLSRGHAGYCAWHSWGSINGVNVQFGFFFKLDGDAGCDPQSKVTGQSEGLAALANVSGHEYSETVTDPRGTGWYDSSGAENGDKCAWTFGAPSVTLANGSQWKIQGNYSNAAAATNSGYDGGGCIQTK